MSTPEEELKERIKEITCLYEVSDILVNADPEDLEKTLKAIAFSLKKAFQYPKYTEIRIQKNTITVETGKFKTQLQIFSAITLFKKQEGMLTVCLNNESLSFLKEEQLLIDNIALKVEDFLERLAIRKNEVLLRRQMEHADRLSIIGELTAGLAHELNTPLANILGFAELLKDAVADNRAVVSDLDKIIKNAIFSREVVKKLMFFARAMPQEKKRINIVPHITSALNLLEATFRKEQVKHHLKIQEDEMFLRADAVQLTQILFNLIINAIYFSPKNGVVTIEVSQNSDRITLKISDEGPGLSEDSLEKVFQPFFTTKPTGEGSGLGLSVVHGIVASHEGSIVAQNNFDKGAIFIVNLPK